MTCNLFHPDHQRFFDLAMLRDAARQEICKSGLVRACASGDRRAAIALHRHFWPFVREFELAIDQQVLPRGPLVQRFAAMAERGAGTGSDVRRTITGMAHAVRLMKEEEGSHAMHWAKDAQQLGIFLDAVGDSAPLPMVQRLIDASYTRNLPQFFAALAGTELVAEELAALLVNQRAFTQLFERKRWVWGETHLMPHGLGPSHLDIDLDLARAYAPDTPQTRWRIESMVLSTIHLFCSAAREIEQRAELDGELEAAQELLTA